jgi:hypothetical protein
MPMLATRETKASLRTVTNDGRRRPAVDPDAAAREVGREVGRDVGRDVGMAIGAPIVWRCTAGPLNR